MFVTQQYRVSDLKWKQIKKEKDECYITFEHVRVINKINNTNIKGQALQQNKN